MVKLPSQPGSRKKWMSVFRSPFTFIQFGSLHPNHCCEGIQRPLLVYIVTTHMYSTDIHGDKTLIHINIKIKNYQKLILIYIRMLAMMAYVFYLNTWTASYLSSMVTSSVYQGSQQRSCYIRFSHWPCSSRAYLPPATSLQGMLRLRASGKRRTECPKVTCSTLKAGASYWRRRLNNYH